MTFPSFAQARTIADNKRNYVRKYGYPENNNWSDAEQRVQQDAPRQQAQPEEPPAAPLAVPKFNQDGSMDALPATAANGGGYSKFDPRIKMVKQAQEGAARRELSRSRGAGEAVSSAEARRSDRSPLFESQARRKRLKAAFPGIGGPMAAADPMSAR